MRIFLVSILYTFSLYGQTYIDTLSFFSAKRAPNVLQTTFEKQLNTYYLNSLINYSGIFGKFSVDLNENYHSTFIRTENKNIRDEHTFLLGTGYNLSKSVQFKISLNNLILSDDRKIEINQASISSLLFMTRLMPYEKTFILPFAGYTNNRQKLENDYGTIYGISGTVDKADLNDLIVSSEVLFRNEDISPRKNYNRLFNIIAVNKFSSLVENSVNLRFVQNRKDFYYDADSITARSFNIKNNIQSRTESNYILQNYLHYNKFLNIFSFDLTGRVLWRKIERDTRYKIFIQPANAIFDTDINELRIEMESGLAYRSSFHNTALRVTYSQKDEKHITQFNPEAQTSIYEARSEQEKRKNNIGARTSVLLSSDLNLSKKDRLTLSFLQNKFRYDTPSEENYDDRDEVLSIGRIRYARYLTPFFEFFTSLEGNYSHIVYIFSEQSSNNYINRILKFNTGGTYLGKNVTSFNSFEVSANYTVYDFEDISPSYRSYSFRQFTASDSTVIKIGKRASLAFNGYVKLSEQGDLKWVSFRTRPNRYLEELYSEPKIRYTTSFLNFSAGIRIFSLKTYSYQNNIRQLSTRYTSTGPVGEFIVSIDKNLKSRFFLWYEFIKMEDTQKKEQVNANIEVQWNF